MTNYLAFLVKKKTSVKETKVNNLFYQHNTLCKFCKTSTTMHIKACHNNRQIVAVREPPAFTIAV